MIVQILQRTPAWVWVLLIALIYLVAGLVYAFLSCTFPARAYAAVRAANHAPPSLARQSA